MTLHKEESGHGDGSLDTTMEQLSSQQAVSEWLAELLCSLAAPLKPDFICQCVFVQYVGVLEGE